MDYLKALHSVCSEVYYKPRGYENKPCIGILVNEGDRKYVIPLSSAKEKHKIWKDVENEKFLIFEKSLEKDMGKRDIWVRLPEETKVKHILGVLDVKKMIPIRDDVYSIVDLNTNENDTVEVRKYKNLLNKEYSFCLKIIDDIIAKADKLYEKQMQTGKIAKFCCDFKALESVCYTYNAKM